MRGRGRLESIVDDDESLAAPTAESTRDKSVPAQDPKRRGERAEGYRGRTPARAGLARGSGCQAITPVLYPYIVARGVVLGEFSKMVANFAESVLVEVSPLN